MGPGIRPETSTSDGILGPIQLACSGAAVSGGGDLRHWKSALLRFPATHPSFSTRLGHHLVAERTGPPPSLSPASSRDHHGLPTAHPGWAVHHGYPAPDPISGLRPGLEILPRGGSVAARQQAGPDDPQAGPGEPRPVGSALFGRYR